jgi:sporulation protein YlmC with PRC-barrel domain
MNTKIYSNHWLTLSAAGLTAFAALAAAQSSNGPGSNTIGSNTAAYSPGSNAPASGTLGQTALANQVFGHQVISSDGQAVGNLNNLVIDLESGRILYGVIGTSQGRVGVAPQVFTSTVPANNTLRINATKQQIDGAPKFDPVDQPGQWGQASYVSQVYSYFGQSPWWQGSTAANVGTFHNVHKASQLVGMKVENVSNQDMGTVKNVAVDLPDGRVVYVVLAPAASLSLSDNLYPLPPQALTLSSDQKTLVSDISKDKLAGAPHFASNSWPNLSDGALAAQVYQFYGKQPWFTGGGLQPTGR